jgi:predicted amidophosphoribosyltransferase
MVSLRDFFRPLPITLDRFKELRATSPKRICFGSTHRTALKKVSGGKAVGFLNLPFLESIDSIFPWQLFKNKNGKFGGYYRAIPTDREYDEIKEWIGDREQVVFIRSLFNTAIACCEHYVGDGRSPIGEIERRAEYEADLAARNQLVDILAQVFDQCLRGKRIQGVVSVPSSDPAAMSLPNFLAQKLSERLGLADLTPALAWNRKKGPIKDLRVDEKWHALEAVGLTVGGGIASKNLLLIDDMYQSGATAHFVASKLREAGASDLHLLCVSKGKRDTDNQ